MKNYIYTIRIEMEDHVDPEDYYYEDGTIVATNFRNDDSVITVLSYTEEENMDIVGHQVRVNFGDDGPNMICLVVKSYLHEVDVYCFKTKQLISVTRNAIIGIEGEYEPH